MIDLLGLIGMFGVDTSLRRRDPGIELDDRIVGAFAGARPGLSKAADRQIYEPRIQRAELFIAEAEPADDAGTKVLHDDVGAACQLFHDAASFIGAEVERDRALAAVEDVEKTGKSVAAAAYVPLDVADQALHFDDGSALIGEQCSGQWPRNDGRQIEDRKAGQRPRHDRAHIRIGLIGGQLSLLASIFSPMVLTDHGGSF